MTESSFSNIGLNESLLQAVHDMGFTHPTPIQVQTIPILLTGRDLTGQAHTGTGKTAAYALPSIQNTTIEKEVQVLVLCPTRELAIQIYTEYRNLLKYTFNIYATPIYGGQQIEKQFKELGRGVQIVIGTPGRVMDHIQRKTLDLSRVHTAILDEADQMLDMGFREDIEEIFSYLPESRQCVIFSATLPKRILMISKQYQKDPAQVRIVQDEMTAAGIQQYYIEMLAASREAALCRILDLHNPTKAMVFTNTRKMADVISTMLKDNGYKAEGLHGDMTQRERDRVMGSFRVGTLTILVATDVAARGIDVDDVDIVFNYDLPQDTEYYVHRIGRTARIGKTGRSISFVTPSERRRMREIQIHTKAHMEKMRVPSIQEVQKARAEDALDAIRNAAADPDLAPYISIVHDLVAEGIDSVTIAATLLKEKSAYKEHITANSVPDARRRERRGDEQRRNGDWKEKERSSGGYKKKRYTPRRSDDEYAPRGDGRGVAVTKVIKRPGKRP
ncbi:MAG: DEAD/DEAH box helicase [Methanomicrobiales archaeon]|nr:DEAD/DEAH box helicase [Methanomicrobiales archaeon]